MDWFSYLASVAPVLSQRTVEHIVLVGIAVGLATLFGVPIGIAISQRPLLAKVVLKVAAVVVTIPSVALFGVLIPILSTIGQGIGYLPAILAVLLYSQLPIIRNTYTAIRSLDPALHEAAVAIGMAPGQRLLQLDIPLAIPLIMAGVRTAVVLNIGVMAIATYIGAGGLGAFVSQGISQSDPRQLIVGSVALSILAIASDRILATLQRKWTPIGIRKRDAASRVQRTA